MKSLNRKLSVLLCAILILGALSACGQAAQQSSDPVSQAAPAAQAAPESASGEETPAPSQEPWKPTKEISVLIGHNAGGGMDVMSRLLVPVLQQELGVSLIPNNMPGSNSAISAEYLIAEPADGYILWAYSAGAVTFPATGLSDLYYKDIQMLAITQGCNPVITVPVDSPITTMEQFMEEVKAGNTTASNSGIGGIWHVPQMMVVNAIGGSVTYVPYDSGKAAATAAAQKEVDWAISDLSEAMTFIQDGLIRPLCVYKVTDLELEGYGNITSILNWLPDLEPIIPATNGFRGVGIKRGAPQDVIDTYIAALEKAVNSEDFIKATEGANIDVMRVFGKEAEDLVEQATKYACWNLFDLGLAERDPAEVGLPR